MGESYYIVVFPPGGKCYYIVGFPWGKATIGERLLYNRGQLVWCHTCRYKYLSFWVWTKMCSYLNMKWNVLIRIRSFYIRNMTPTTSNKIACAKWRQLVWRHRYKYFFYFGYELNRFQSFILWVWNEMLLFVFSHFKFEIWYDVKHDGLH